MLLYELLTGHTPFDAKELMQSGLDELRRTIREKEPARPSTRLSTMLQADLTDVAQRRQSEAPKLIHSLRGDLDWIVMKTLEKDRTRRYETANALAVDIQRYLSNEPVSARPPSTVYRFQKLVRRNKTMFIAAGVGMAALVIGLVLALYLYAQEKAAFKRAVAAEQAERQLRQDAEKSAGWGQQITRAGLLLMRGQYDASEKALQGIPPRAVLVPFYNVFGDNYARHGQWREALTNWQWVVQYAPADHLGYRSLAPLFLQLDDVAGYERCRAQILQQFGNTADPRIAERMVKASLILPPAPDELAVIAKMADVAMNTETNTDTWGMNLFAKGLAEYRQGKYDRAVKALRQVGPLDVGSRCHIEAHLVLAMAYFQLKQLDKSQESFADAMEAVNEKLPKAGNLDDNWPDWIIIQCLMREAVAMIPKPPAAAPAQPAPPNHE